MRFIDSSDSFVSVYPEFNSRPSSEEPFLVEEQPAPQPAAPVLQKRPGLLGFASLFRRTK